MQLSLLPLVCVRQKALLAFLYVLTTGLAGAATVEGRVMRVADGDTITVLDVSNSQHKVRLAGIDAPEKKQAFGKRSKESLSGLVFGKSVTLETYKLDLYGREISKVLVGDLDVNLEQVKRGMAWHYKAYQREQLQPDRASYAKAEEDARAARVGLWVDAQPMPPWEFRHKK